MKTKIILGVILLIGAAAAGLVGIWKYEHAKVARLVAAAPGEATLRSAPPAPRPAATPARTPQPSPALPPAATPQPTLAAQAAPAASPTPPPAPRVKYTPPQPAMTITEPLAREALNYVGDDANAEAVWVSAINDPSLSNNARSNLIEDLNENGFPDPNHPTPADLPLIVSRIQLIEALGPDAMDDVNAAAFQEAYKDLVNMFADVTGMSR